jgi:hypothetical protein
VINNLGVGVPESSSIYSTIKDLQETARDRLLVLAWDPSGLKRKVLQQRLAKLPPQARALLSLEMKRMEDRLAFKQDLMQRAEQRKLLARQLKAQLEARARDQARLNDMLGDLLRESSEIIAEKLRDEEPVTRWLAVLAVARKRLPLEGRLIDLLSDPAPLVRDAAHQALVRLSRGNDFGPPREASPTQVAQAVRAWCQWYDLQDWPAVAAETQSGRVASERPPE